MVAILFEGFGPEAVAGGAEVETVGGIEFWPGEAGGVEHGRGDVDVGSLRAAVDLGLD